MKGLALFWPFLIESLAFFRNFVDRFWPFFLLKVWPFFLNKSGNPALNCSSLLVLILGSFRLILEGDSPRTSRFSRSSCSVYPSSSFEWVVTIHYLATLDLGAAVEQPIDCLIIQNRQAVHSTRRPMDWTLEDNMVDGLFFCATLTGHRRKQGPSLLKNFVGDKPLLSVCRWRHRVHSTVIQPFCKIDQMGDTLWNLYILVRPWWW